MQEKTLSSIQPPAINAIPADLQARIVDLRDEQTYHMRRLNEINAELSKIVNMFGGNVEMFVVPKQVQAQQPTAPTAPPAGGSRVLPLKKSK